MQRTSLRNCLILVDAFPPVNTVGIHRTVALCRHLAAQGWRVTVITAAPGAASPAAQAAASVNAKTSAMQAAGLRAIRRATILIGFRILQFPCRLLPFRVPGPGGHKCWCARRDSNAQPSDSKSATLSIELRAQDFTATTLKATRLGIRRRQRQPDRHLWHAYVVENKRRTVKASCRQNPGAIDNYWRMIDLPQGVPFGSGLMRRTSIHSHRRHTDTKSARKAKVPRGLIVSTLAPRPRRSNRWCQHRSHAMRQGDSDANRIA